MKKDSYESDFKPGKIHHISKMNMVFSLDMLPAVVLYNPKNPYNLGAAFRAASCFGCQTIIYTGNRVNEEINKYDRLPRELRIKKFCDVTIFNDEYFFDRFPKEVTPVAIEMRENAESLTIFEHPEFPLYVFGPEDGDIPQVVLRHCHRFVSIPSKHCLNLGNAVNVVLYDRLLKMGIVK